MRIAAALVVVSALGAASPQAQVSASDAKLLGEMVVAAASADGRLAVLSSSDVRAAIDVEAQRALAGCDETSCMKESRARSPRTTSCTARSARSATSSCSR